MSEKIISYLEMCQIEGTSLQKGMNYQLRGGYSVLLMSVRANAPYRDLVLDDGNTLIYEGHDVQKSAGINVKKLDQPERTKTGKPTENGKFYKAAQDYKNNLRSPELVRVYEKLRDGIWAQNDFFYLVDAWKESDGGREVFKFKLQPAPALAETQPSLQFREVSPQRIIPSAVKNEVWLRDQGKCVLCGSKDQLHFDHIIPYSKGGTSMRSENIQILCARHNLEKRDRIE